MQPLQGHQQSSWWTPVLKPSSNPTILVVWVTKPTADSQYISGQLQCSIFCRCQFITLRGVFEEGVYSFGMLGYLDQYLLQQNILMVATISTNPIPSALLCNSAIMLVHHVVRQYHPTAEIFSSTLKAIFWCHQACSKGEKISKKALRIALVVSQSVLSFVGVK